MLRWVPDPGKGSNVKDIRGVKGLPGRGENPPRCGWRLTQSNNRARNGRPVGGLDADGRVEGNGRVGLV